MNRAVPLVVFLLLSLALFPGAMAHHTPTHGTVSNKPPEVAQIDAPDSVNPIAGGDRIVDVRITVFEPNGWRDVQRVEVTVYHPDAETIMHQMDATPDGDGTGTQRDYEAAFPMAFYEAPANQSDGYIIEAVARDNPGTESDPSYHNFAYTELTALSLDVQQMQFPETEPGESSDPVPVGVRNVGNLPLGLEVAGMPLVSEEGHQIPESNLRVDGENDVYTNGTALSQEPAPLQGFHLEPGPDSSKDTWWVLQAPTGESGYLPAGDYSGSIQLDAVDAS